MVKVWQRDLEGARKAAEHALVLGPNSARAHSTLGIALIYLGQPEQALEPIRRSLQLNPGFAHQTLHFLGLAEYLAGRYEAALATLRERVRLAPGTDLGRAFLAAALGQLGRFDAARQVWADLMAINPKYSLADHLDRSPFRRAQDVARITEGLAKAGLPD